MPETTPPRAFVIGDPIAHSRSPKIHGHWLQRYDIAGAYEAVHVTDAQLKPFFEDIRSGQWIGGNVTLPHKQAVLGLVDELTETAATIGAVNTVYRHAETGALIGDNTDAYGFAANLNASGASWRQGKSALVLGAGGAAPAIVHALIEAGYAKIGIANRTPEKAEALCRRLGGNVEPVSWDSRETFAGNIDLLVNATSLGMKDQPPLAFDVSSLGPATIVTDIVYTPLHTPLLRDAASRVLTIVTGLGMLLHQAAPGFERWFGPRPKIDDKLFERVAKSLGEGRR